VSISVSPFFTEELADRHVHHVGAEALAGELERRLRARRGFEEQVDLRQAPQRRSLLLRLTRNGDGRVGAVEQYFDVEWRKVADAKKMAVRVGRQGR
jgi:hypothetical protein